MLRQQFNIVLFALLLTIALQSQSITQLRIRENPVFSESVIRGWVNVRLPKQYSSAFHDSLCAALTTQLQNNGFFQSNVSITLDSVRTDSTRYLADIGIKEGAAAVLSDIEYAHTDSLLLKRIKTEDQFLIGALFSKKTVEDFFSTILNYLQDSGYPFAAITLHQVQYDSISNSVKLHVNCSPGKLCKLDRISIDGNKDTKAYVIIRELPYTTGDVYNQTKIDKTQEVLNKTKLFDIVSEPQYYITDKDQGTLLITVKEKNTNTFDGVIGYQPSSNENEKGYLTGLLNIGFKNLFGTGRATSVHWQKIDRLSSEFELRYLEPWIMDYPFNINLMFYQKQQDSTYVQSQFEGSVEYLATSEMSISLQYGLTNVIPSVLSNNTYTVFNSTTTSAGFKLKIDSRDDPLSPRKGLLFINSYSLNNKRIKGSTELVSGSVKTKNQQQKLLVDLSMFFELFSKQVFSVSLHGRELRGDLIEVSDLFKFGGANTLRGYRENQFLGQRIAWVNTEYRFLLEKRAYAFLFVDNGYYLQKENVLLSTPEASDFKMGYGLGLAFESSLGIINVSFAFAKGDGFSQGKIHFGLANEF